MKKQKVASDSSVHVNWMRISLIEEDHLIHEVFKRGTIYGRTYEILSQQISQLLKSKWKISNSTMRSICKGKQTINFKVSPAITLGLSFEIPGRKKTRTTARIFKCFYTDLESRI